MQSGGLECTQVDPKAADVLDTKLNTPLLQPSPHLWLNFGLTPFGMMAGTDDDERVMLAAFSRGHRRQPPDECVHLAHRLLYRPPVQVDLRQVNSHVAVATVVFLLSRRALMSLTIFRPQAIFSANNVHASGRMVIGDRFTDGVPAKPPHARPTKECLGGPCLYACVCAYTCTRASRLRVRTCMHFRVADCNHH